MIDAMSYNDSERFRIDDCIKTFSPKECVTSEEDSNWSLILEGYLSPVVAAVGFFGNAISTWVLCDSSFTHFTGTFNRLLVSLAVFDMMSLCKNISTNYI